jgi:hypothetical protein
MTAALGDTAIHSVEPDAAAQVQCKANRQVMMVTKDSGGDNIMVNVDGKNNKIQISGWGGIIQMSKDDGISIVAPDGKSSIIMKDGSIMLVGTVVLGGIVPTNVFVGGPPATVTGPTAIPLPGVFHGV